MEKNRKRALRRHHARRVFKARLKNVAVSWDCQKTDWKELYHEKWTQIFRTTGTICSCWMCKEDSYDRVKYRKEASRIICEYLDEINQENY